MMVPAGRNEAKRLHVLVSYAYWDNAAGRRKLEDAPVEWNLMLDSGAFTNFTQGKAATTVDAYAGFCREYTDRFWRIINLDRIGDGESSARNLRALHGMGIPALPVFQRGEPLSALADMAGQGSPVCIGGISQNVGASAEQAYLRGVMEHVQRLRLKTHLLGVGGDALFNLPCWSGDSSSWEMGARYGRIRLWDGARFVPFDKSPTGRSGNAYIKPDVARTRVLRSYDLTWGDLREYRKWSLNEDSAVYLASIRSWMRLALALTRADKRYIFATPVSHMPILARAWDLEKHRWGF